MNDEKKTILDWVIKIYVDDDRAEKIDENPVKIILMRQQEAIGYTSATELRKAIGEWRQRGSAPIDSIGAYRKRQDLQQARAGPYY